MDTTATLELVLRILREASLQEHIDTIGLRSRAEKREVEEVAVECSYDCRLYVLDMSKKSSDSCSLTKSAPVNRCDSLRNDDAPRLSR